MCVQSSLVYQRLKFKFQLKMWGLRSLSRGASVHAPLNESLTPVHVIPFIAPLYIKFFIEFPIVSHTTLYGKTFELEIFWSYVGNWLFAGKLLWWHACMLVLSLDKAIGYRASSNNLWEKICDWVENCENRTKDLPHAVVAKVFIVHYTLAIIY